MPAWEHALTAAVHGPATPAGGLLDTPAEHRIGPQALYSDSSAPALHPGSFTDHGLRRPHRADHDRSRHRTTLPARYGVLHIIHKQSHPSPDPLPIYRRLRYIPYALPGWVKNRPAFWLTFQPARARRRPWRRRAGEALVGAIAGDWPTFDGGSEQGDECDEDVGTLHGRWEEGTDVSCYRLVGHNDPPRRTMWVIMAHRCKRRSAVNRRAATGAYVDEPCQIFRIAGTEADYAAGLAESTS